MPWHYQIKPWITLASYAQSKFTGKGFRDEAHEKRQTLRAKWAGWTIVATTVIPFLIDVYMKRGGWEVDYQERESGFRKFADRFSRDIPIGGGKTANFAPNWAPTWRYSKTIETITGPKKMTRVMNHPMVTFTRLGVRATKPMPENVKNEVLQGIWDASWAEAHPFYKISYAFAGNEPLSYGGMPPMGIDGEDYIGGLGEYLKASVRVYGALASMEKSKSIGESEADRLLDEHLSVTEKMLTLWGYDYVSSTDDQKKIGKVFQLIDNAKEMGRLLGRANLTEEEKSIAVEKLRIKIKDSFGRISNGETK